MDVLEHHLKPLRALPGVVLEQSYLNKMAEGLRPLAQLAATNAGNIFNDSCACIALTINTLTAISQGVIYIV